MNTDYLSQTNLDRLAQIWDEADNNHGAFIPDVEPNDDEDVRELSESEYSHIADVYERNWV